MEESRITELTDSLQEILLTAKSDTKPKDYEKWDVMTSLAETMLDCYIEYFSWEQLERVRENGDEMPDKEVRTFSDNDIMELSNDYISSLLIYDSNLTTEFIQDYPGLIECKKKVVELQRICHESKIRKSFNP